MCSSSTRANMHHMTLRGDKDPEQVRSLVEQHDDCLLPLPKRSVRRSYVTLRSGCCDLRVCATPSTGKIYIYEEKTEVIMIIDETALMFWPTYSTQIRLTCRDPGLIQQLAIRRMSTSSLVAQGRWSPHVFCRPAGKWPLN